MGGAWNDWATAANPTSLPNWYGPTIGTTALPTFMVTAANTGTTYTQASSLLHG